MKKINESEKKKFGSKFLVLNIPGCKNWTEEEWKGLASAIGATLVPLEGNRKEQ